MRTSEHVLERPGAQLYFDAYLPDGEPTAVVHIVHGLAEHAARYQRLAASLVEAGWAVYAHDQRGHGRSAKSEADLGYFADEDGWPIVVGDLRAFMGRHTETHPGLPQVIIGHSMGSLILQDYLSRYSGGGLAAAALSGTSGPPPPIATLGRVVARIERLRQGPRGRSQLIDKMAFGAFNKAFEPARTPFDWLSRDPAEVDLYVNDSWCGFLGTNQLWVDLLDGVARITRPKIITHIPPSLPIYLFSGDADPVGSNGVGVKALADRYRQVGLSDVTIELYPEGRHEILNETNRDAVTADLLKWIRDRLDPDARPAARANSSLR